MCATFERYMFWGVSVFSSGNPCYVAIGWLVDSKNPEILLAHLESVSENGVFL